MIFQPAIIALLLASGLGVAMLAAATPFAIEIIRRWNLASGSELQLRLERRTYLFSTLVTFVLAIQLLALLLFVFNADRMSVMFVGAMCAVGTLNADAYGFPALLAQIGTFFLATTWLAINHVDSRARDYPLVKLKYGLLIGLLPALLAVAALEWLYFSNLNADVITSCCGSLFSSDAKGISSDLAALPPGPALIAFYGSLGAACAGCGWYGRYRRGGYLVALFSTLAFAAAISGVLSFVSLYVYENPHHHCPFCLLKPEYDWQGYGLYIPLFVATGAGIAVGALQPFRGISSLAQIVPTYAARLAIVAAWGFALFAIIATWMIWSSRLILFE